MSEQVLVLNERTELICAGLGAMGIKHVEVDRYRVNNKLTTSVRATGDLGEGLVTVSAVDDGYNRDYMMQGPPRADGDPYLEVHGADTMYGDYRDVGHDLLSLLAEHPDAGGIDLPLAA